jgi:hypothetical protein
MSKKPPVKVATSKSPGEGGAKGTNIFAAKWMPWTLAAVVFVLVAMYFAPVLQGKMLSSHDSDQYLAMFQEVNEYNQKGETIYWTTRLFSGMPAALISVPTFNIFTYAWIYINKVIPSPLIEFLLMAFSAFFIFRLLGFGYLECFVASLIFGFGSANFISVSAGHMTKVRAIAVAPILVGAAWMALNGRWFRGGALFAVILGLQISFNHIQITYFTFIIIGVLYIAMLVQAIREKAFKNLGVGTGLLALGVVFGAALNSAMMINTYDYSAESTRGKRILTELQQEGETQRAQQTGETGVGIAYATNWSQGIGECMTFLIPNFYGGASAGSLDENSHTYKTLTGKGVPPASASRFVSGLPMYWGSQPFVAGPIYFGAVVIMLFVIGLFLVKGVHKWWMLAAILLTVLISFGKNALWFYQLLYDYLPMFNKFRSPTMILALTQMLMAGLGVMALAVMLKKGTDLVAVQKSLKLGGGIVLGICLLMATIGSSLLSFSNNYKEATTEQSVDERFLQQLQSSVGDENFANEIFGAIKKDRASLMSKDALRSAIFVALALAMLFVASMGKLGMPFAVIGVAVLALADLWGVNKRYLDEGNFEDKSLHVSTIYRPTQADQVIMQNGADGRMLDVTVNMFNDAVPSYFHQNIGGYNPAKLRRYQDLIERGISRDLGALNVSGFENIPVLNMLNMKFIKTGSEAKQVIQNPYAFGNAWLVDSVAMVETDLEEIESLYNYDLKQHAIVHKEFEGMLDGFTPVEGAEDDIIALKSYHPNKIEYISRLSAPRIAVFSEVIYKPNIDWTSTIDGKEHPHFRANYILRAMLVPAGEHTITFTFKPRAYSRFTMVSATASGIVVLLIGFGAYRTFRNRKNT